MNEYIPYLRWGKANEIAFVHEALQQIEIVDSIN